MLLHQHVGKQPLWAAVRAEWAALAARPQPLSLRGAPDKDQLFVPLFAYAAELEAAATPPAAEVVAAKARELVRAYLRDEVGDAAPVAPGY